jgi:limonene-1,2-epoxide hydrolase
MSSSLRQTSFDVVQQAWITATNGFRKPDSAPIQNDHLRHLRQYFRYGLADPMSVYRDCFRTYAERYTLPGIEKNRVLLQELCALGILPKAKHILDLGCGPGSFTLAYLLQRMEHPRLTCQTTTITMVDAVSEFLTLFQETWNAIPANHTSGIQVNLRNIFITEGFLRYVPQPDLIILSNSVTEILRNSHVDARQFLADCVDSRAVIAIVDYDYSTSAPFLTEFADALAAHCTNLNTPSSSWDRRYRAYDAVNLGKLRDIRKEVRTLSQLRNANVSFLKAIWAPSVAKAVTQRSVPATVVGSYKKAWEQHDLSILRELFTKDAIYVERKGQEPFSGIESICAYWSRNATQQTSVDFQADRIDYDGTTVTADWRCRFFRRDLAKWMYLTGVFKAKLRNNKVCFFSETFKKSFTGFPDSPR